MALAPVAYCLWNRHLRFDPENPDWVARDRFILSCGHASMLLYSLLHLADVKKTNPATGELDSAVSLDDIRNFRQLHSPCAGHPEYGYAPGIETTTGPLGQGVANSVGMAIASKYAAANLVKGAKGILDYNVYAICSDGDLMEGIGCEAASLAGHLKLDNLCWIYDDNHITIEGHTDLAYTEDVGKKFEALGWNTNTVSDANDIESIDAALESFAQNQDGPTLIILKSIIGYGAPNKQDSDAAHGAPLGVDEVAAAKQFYGWPEEDFLVPDQVMEHFREGIGQRGGQAFKDWQRQLAQQEDSIKSIVHQYENGNPTSQNWHECLPEFPADAKGMATRSSSGKVLNAIAAQMPDMIGGSADLAGSNKSMIDGEESFSAQNRTGRNLHFGVREHAMAAICNGLSLAGLRPYAATFFVFTDYFRPSMRLASLMKQGVIYILTHDSIGLGEDGPTHQPVEHLAACRGIPGLNVIRPADANEVTEAYRVAIEQDSRPTALILTRQNLPTLDRSEFAPASGARKGAYVLKDYGTPEVILIGTGSELHIAIDAAESMAKQGRGVRLVSMPMLGSI